MAFVTLKQNHTGDLPGGSVISTPIVVDMDFPINPKAASYATDGGVSGGQTVIKIACTGLPSPNTHVKFDYGATPVTPITEDQIIESLNTIIGKTIADPYIVPTYSAAYVEAGYLEPDTKFAVADFEYAT